MQYTIKGKKKDVILTDDRLICDGKEYLYENMSGIWTLNFMGTSIDCTYNGRHEGFKIDKAAFDEATKAAAEVQEIIETRMAERFDAASQLQTSEEMYQFCKDEGLLEAMINKGWFCSRMDAIMGKLSEDEKILLPFESTCGLGLAWDEKNKTVISIKNKEAQFVGALTNKRLIFYTSGALSSREREIRLDQIVGTQCMKRGLRFSLLIFTKKKEDATGILVLGETQAKVMQRAIEKQAQGRA